VKLYSLHSSQVSMVLDNSVVRYIHVDSGIESNFYKRYKSESKVDESHT